MQAVIQFLRQSSLCGVDFLSELIIASAFLEFWCFNFLALFCCKYLYYSFAGLCFLLSLITICCSAAFWSHKFRTI